MSPLGRVFIVLNVILAGTFVGFAGTYLQKQHNWKTQYDNEKKAHDADNAKAASEKSANEQEIAKLNTDKGRLETELGSTRVDRDAKADEIKTLQGRVASTEADVKKLTSVAEATKTAM